MTRAATSALLGLFSLLGALAWADTAVLAPGCGELDYEPPAPGTYTLPPWARPRTARCSTPAANPAARRRAGGKLVLLGFIYTHCPDVNGCPLASFVMKQVQARLLADEDLSDQVRLISLSFDRNWIRQRRCGSIPIISNARTSTGVS